jgi:hypothetical protein
MNTAVQVRSAKRKPWTAARGKSKRKFLPLARDLFLSDNRIAAKISVVKTSVASPSNAEVINHGPGYPFSLEEDSPELEAELLKAANGPFAPYSKKEMRAACERALRTAQRKRPFVCKEGTCLNGMSPASTFGIRWKPGCRWPRVFKPLWNQRWRKFH